LGTLREMGIPEGDRMAAGIIARNGGWGKEAAGQEVDRQSLVLARIPVREPPYGPPPLVS
jgi:hypothetical protein